MIWSRGTSLAHQNTADVWSVARALGSSRDPARLQVLALVNNPHYLYRMTILVAIGNLAPVVSHDVLCNNMLPVVIACSQDKVPNIKFNVAKMLKQLIPLVDASILHETIKPCLVSLSEDTDTDVRYFARQALSSTEQIAAV